ncbi:MAG TPA: c-type cytochrome domain-containing protein [Saprospiraceae bacterium]|nr:c-type cytochrome domain-containing protein [Saprospiraceae bacterium]
MWIKSSYTRIITLVVIFVFGLGLQFCTKETLPEPAICFSEDIYPIILSNCTQSVCHDPYFKADGIDLTTYDEILKEVKPGDFRNSRLYTSLVADVGGDIMPPKSYSVLSDEKIALIARWIKEGAINTSNCQSACDTTNATFSGKIVPLMETYCNGCHAGYQIQGNIDLSSYSKIKPYVTEGRFLGSIKHEIGYSEMPKNGASLSDCKISIIEQWIKEGALNN